MENKDLRVVAIGLIVILIITAAVVYGNFLILNPALKEIGTLSSMVQQKDLEIRKLIKQLKAKEGEINSVKEALDDATKKLDMIKSEINAPTPVKK